MKQHGSRNKGLIFLTVALLFGACATPDDQASDPGPVTATPVATMPQELEPVLQYLQQVQGDGSGAAAIRAQLGALAQQVFVAALDGREEVPPTDSRASALAALLLINPAAGDIVIALLHDVANATAAHIHRGAAGQNGPVLVALDATRVVSISRARLTASQVADLQAGRLYTNVHSKRFPGGEIRGQLLHLGETLFTAALSGANEVPPTGSTATGALAVILDPAGDSIRYEGVFAGLSSAATVAHIHAGVAGVNGAVRFPLTIVESEPPVVGSGGLAGTQAVTPEDVAALNAAAFYTNVHSARFGAGEIRGQLIRR